MFITHLVFMFHMLSTSFMKVQKYFASQNFTIGNSSNRDNIQ
jgi:hypothetical protein